MQAGTGNGEDAPRAAPGRGAPRGGPRRLRDISHLYLSNRDAVPRARRCLRIGMLASGDALADAETCANLAVQLARLGRRTVLADASLALPSPGARLGLEPAAYLAGRFGTDAALDERGALGVRVIPAGAVAAAETLADALRGADAVVLRLPLDPGAVLAAVAAPLAAADAPTTMERAATRSPMFEAWMSTARRSERRPPAARLAAAPAPSGRSEALDVVLRVYAGGPAPGAVRFGRLAVQTIGWADVAPPGDGVCARVPRYRIHARLALSAVDPEHPAARVYEGLAQGLLSGLGRSGGARREP